MKWRGSKEFWYGLWKIPDPNHATAACRSHWNKVSSLCREKLHIFSTVSSILSNVIMYMWALIKDIKSVVLAHEDRYCVTHHPKASWTKSSFMQLCVVSLGSGYCNKVPQTGWLQNSKILLPCSGMAIFSLQPQVAEGTRNLSGACFISALISFMKVLPSSSPKGLTS